MKFEIHPYFLKDVDFNEFEKAFRQIHVMFYQIYTDISHNPEDFGFELYKQSEYNYFSKEGREAKSKPWYIFYLILYMFYSGDFKNDMFIVNAEKFKLINKIKKTGVLIKALTDYGFVFTGIKNYKQNNISI